MCAKLGGAPIFIVEPHTSAARAYAGLGGATQPQQPLGADDARLICELVNGQLFIGMVAMLHRPLAGSKKLIKGLQVSAHTCPRQSIGPTGPALPRLHAIGCSHACRSSTNGARAPMYSDAAACSQLPRLRDWCRRFRKPACGLCRGRTPGSDSSISRRAPSRRPKRSGTSSSSRPTGTAASGEPFVRLWLN